jgi:hypothetical protein
LAIGAAILFFLIPNFYNLATCGGSSVGRALVSKSEKSQVRAAAAFIYKKDVIAKPLPIINFREKAVAIFRCVFSWQITD